MKRKFLKSAVAGAIAVASLLGTSDGAFAVDSSNANAGFDDQMDTIIGSGSDTTFLMLQKLELLYNQTPGCNLKNGPLPTDRGCTVPSPATAPTTENYDHDTVVGEFPIGSSAGVARVIAGTADYGRSSRNRRTDGSENAAVFSGFAKGALVPITFNGRATGNLTKQQLKDIFVNCTLNNWSQLGQASAPIRPYGVQTSSGTYLAFRDYLDGQDPNTCANAIGTGRVFFENNTAPIDGGTGTDGSVFPSPATDRNDAIWWMEFADIQTNPSRRGTAGFWNVEGQSPSPASQIANNIYPITRFMWHVNLKTQLTATGGKAGAAGAMMEWLCRNGGHGTNFNSGNNVNNDINAAITSTGFVRTPLAQGNNHPVSGAPLRCKLDFAAPF